MAQLRKWQALAAAGLLGTALLGGCGGAAVDEPAVEQPEAGSAVVEVVDDVVETDDAEAGDFSEAESDFPTGEHVDLDQVLFDEAGIKVTATGFGPVFYYAALSIDIENTTDETVTVWLEDSSLNGWSWDASLVTGLEDGQWNEDNGLQIAPGETLSCGIGFSNTSFLEDCEIEEMAQVGFKLAAYAGDAAEAFVRTPELVVDLPGHEGYTQNYSLEGNVVYDTNDITIIARDIQDDGWGGYTLPLFVENLSDRDIVVRQVSRTVDGTVTEEETPMQIASVAAGKRAIASPWIEEELTPDSSYELTLSIEVIDPNTYETIEEIATITATNAS